MADAKLKAAVRADVKVSGKMYDEIYFEYQLKLEISKRGFQEATCQQAQYELGKMYLNGQGVQQNDYLAEHWFRAANYAEIFCRNTKQKWNRDITTGPYVISLHKYHGHAEASFQLGLMLEKYRGKSRLNAEFGMDDNAYQKEAFYWFKKAEHLGYGPEAEYKLGEMYLGGVGVTLNTPVGMWWLREAALISDHPDSCFELGQMFKNGFKGSWSDIMEFDHEEVKARQIFSNPKFAWERWGHEQELCAICLRLLATHALAKETTTLPCGHIFHLKCMEEFSFMGAKWCQSCIDDDAAAAADLYATGLCGLSMIPPPEPSLGHLNAKPESFTRCLGTASFYYEEAVKYGHLKSGSDSEESMSSEGSEDAVCQSALELKIKTAETEASEKREKRPKIE